MSRRNKTGERIAAPSCAAARNDVGGTVMTADAFSNPAFRLGYGTQSPLEGTQYPITRLTQNYALLNSLYRDNWIVQNIITTIPDDMLREWITLTGVTPEAQTQFERLARKTQLRRRLTDGMYWGRLYGGAVGVMLIRGQEDLAQPLDLDRVLPGAFTGLYLVDRWSGVEPEMGLVTDMADPDFGMPEYYSVRDASGAVVQRVHHSKVIRFVGRELPYYEKIAESYWGESELEAIYAEIVKRDNVSHNIAALTFKARQEYQEMDNLDQLFSIGPAQQQERFWRTMQAQSVLSSNFGVRLVNKGDAIHTKEYTFSGLSDVYETVMMDVSGAARIPVTKLFGRSPAGLNATGESDLQNYYDYVDTLRESFLRPILERLLPVLALSCWGAVPDALDVAFPPLWTPKATEVAEIAERKAGTVAVVWQAGLLDQGAAQRELKKLSGETGMFDSIPDEQIAANAGVSYQERTAMRDPLAGLLDGPEEEPRQTMDGGAGSGNFNHAGRPGQIGGSAPGGSSGLTSHGKGGTLQSSKRPEWRGEQAIKPFRYWDLSTDKTGFPTKWVAKGFSSPDTLKRHFENHGESVQAKDAAEYETQARSFLTSPRGTHGDAFVARNLDVFRYDYDTKQFAVATSTGTIKTYWRVSGSAGQNDTYWLSQKERWG